MQYRLARADDLSDLAQIYCSLFTNPTLDENWSQEAALKLLQYFYTLNPEIFVVATIDDRPIGAIMSLVKPWYDGNRLIETEVFVQSEYQKAGIGSQLFLEHFRLATEKYKAKTIEAHTYEEADGYPLNWYRKQGYKVAQDLFVIEGEVKQVYEYLKAR